MPGAEGKGAGLSNLRLRFRPQVWVCWVFECGRLVVALLVRERSQETAERRPSCDDPQQPQLFDVQLILYVLAISYILHDP